MCSCVCSSDQPYLPHTRISQVLTGCGSYYFRLPGFRASGILMTPPLQHWTHIGTPAFSVDARVQTQILGLIQQVLYQLSIPWSTWEVPVVEVTLQLTRREALSSQAQQAVCSPRGISSTLPCVTPGTVTVLLLHNVYTMSQIHCHEFTQFSCCWTGYFSIFIMFLLKNSQLTSPLQTQRCLAQP